MRLLAPAFKGFSQKKKIKIYIVAISITFGMIISVIYSMYQFNKIYSDKVKNNILNRVIGISVQEDENANEILEYVASLKNINVAYRRVRASMSTDENINFSAQYVSKEEVPEVVNGNTFSNDEEIQVVIPNKMFDQESRGYTYLDSLVGKDITLTADELVINAKVVGVYQADDYETSAYINEAFKEALIEYNPEVEDNYAVYAVVNDYDNVDATLKILTDKGYYADVFSKSGQRDVNLYNTAKAIIILILVFTVVFTYISISIIISGIIADEKMDIAIFKAIGYKIKDISKIIRYRVVAILGISILIGMIISFIGNKVITAVIKYKLDILLQNDFKTYGVLIIAFSLCIYVISVVAVKISSFRIKKINTIELLKEN